MGVFSCCWPIPCASRMSPERSTTLALANKFLMLLDNVKPMAVEKGTEVESSFYTTVLDTVALKKNVQGGEMNLMRYYIDKLSVHADYLFNSFSDDINHPAIYEAINEAKKCSDDLIDAANAVRFF